MEPIRIALFGNGFARTVMLPGLAHVENAEVVGIASPNAERAQATAAEFGIDAVSSSHKELLAQTSPDLVFVVTPPHRHLEQTVDALEAGCHVVCEKPTALSARESAQMLAAAQRFPDRITLIDHELRLDPRRRLLRAWVQSGRLGTIQHATYNVNSTAMRDAQRPWSWWSDAAQGGGILGAIGSHAVDSLRSLLGEVQEVRGTLQTFTTHRTDPATGEARAVTSDDFASAWLRFESGALATMTLSTIEGERSHRMTIAGSAGCIALDEQQPLRAGFDGNALEAVTVDEEFPGNDELGIPNTDWARNFVRLSRSIASAIRAGSSTVADAATFEDGHRNQQVLDAIRRSSDEGGWQTCQ